MPVIYIFLNNASYIYIFMNIIYINIYIYILIIMPVILKKTLAARSSWLWLPGSQIVRCCYAGGSDDLAANKVGIYSDLLWDI